MTRELCEWLEENDKNAIVNRSGHVQDLWRWYTDFGVKWIAVTYEENEHELNAVAVELPKDRAKLVRFLLGGLDHSEECTYSENLNLLYVSFDG